jgi:putative inorganic carbon (HCO3(-)) transporter
MKLTEFSLETAAFYLTCGSVLGILCSIAVSNVLLALAFAALLMSNQRMRFPPFWIPLAAFFAGTAISLVLSPNWHDGRPAMRKFFCFLMVLIVYSNIRTVQRARGLLLAAVGIMSFSALWSLTQFAGKVSEARELGQQFYTHYMQERITGFMSHWMTLGGQEMILILMAGSFLFFSAERKWKPWLIAAIGVIGISIVAGYTRSIWFGTFCGAVYLIWFWKRWVLLLLPVPVLLLVLINPFAFRERVLSSFKPHGDTDSNEFRAVCRRAGFAMIQAHPWFGLGPEQVKLHLKEWIPADVPRPLPTGWYGHLHNIYLHYAADRGILTLLAFLWMLGKIVYDFVRALRRAGPGDHEVRAILHGAIAMMAGILVVGFYEVNLGDSEVLVLFLSVVACAYVAVDAIQGSAPHEPNAVPASL